MMSHVSRRFLIGLALVSVLGLISAVPLGVVSANGSVKLVVIDEVAGPYLLRVGVLPAEPIAGPLHVSLLLLTAEDKEPVEDATVGVASSGPGTPDSAEAVNSPQSPQLYEGNLLLDALGDWEVTLDIDSPAGPASHTFGVKARAESGFNLMFAIAVAAAVLVVGSLVLSQLQRRRRLGRGR